jgi:hypothetical protein
MSGVESTIATAAAAPSTGPIQIESVGTEINDLIEKAGGRTSTFAKTEVLLETNSPHTALLSAAADNTDRAQNASTLAVVKKVTCSLCRRTDVARGVLLRFTPVSSLRPSMRAIQ